MSPPFKERLSCLHKSTLFTVLGTTILFLTFFIRNPSYVWIEIWFLLEILVLTFSTKTVSLRYGFELFCQVLLEFSVFTIRRSGKDLWLLLKKS